MAVRAAGTIFGPGLQLWFSSLQEIHHAGDFAEDFLHGKSIGKLIRCRPLRPSLSGLFDRFDAERVGQGGWAISDSIRSTRPLGA
ncbi:hypothetical protein BofuT4_uP136370.1 [Botrytis cinerea T4]|uniref:Uncharacterized protein n=1 Tax=Botryotinia fuckeliana (strain T4) TaxID=999810 RepID=G2YPP4_BOTF4|nr:hypothetical protein BofuT4_uP136370.1 [Botrytis cinerea T4]